jgi:transcriptional regulator with XRE-family HTH domain
VPVRTNKNQMDFPVTLTTDRDVVRCTTCGLVQYRLRTDTCRRCVHLLPQPAKFLLPSPTPEAAADPTHERFVNQKTVENIGQRIRQLRESRGLSQCQLQSRSKVSRSYLSRIESGQMTPGLGTVEKISDALGVGLSRIFIRESVGEALLGDRFVQGLHPYLRQLRWEQWESILKRLHAIGDPANRVPATLHPIGRPARLRQSTSASAHNS